MASEDEKKQLQDLVSFLRSPRVDIRKAAVGMVQGLTATPEGAEQLRSESDELLPALLWLMNDEAQVSKAALTSLVNLSQDTDTATKLLRMKCIEKSVDYIRDGSASTSPELLTMLLTNVTTTEAGSKQLLQVGKGDLEGFNIGVLLSRFVETVESVAATDPYAYVAHILTNITRLQAGRLVVMEPGRGFLQALVSQLEAGGPCGAVRRQGCATAFRNICFGTQGVEDEEALKPILSNPEILKAVTQPLSGESSAAAADDTTREALSEAVLILASSDEGRKALWSINAPELLRKGYEGEENGSVCRSMERTAELFISGGSEIQEIDESEDKPETLTLGNGSHIPTDGTVEASRAA